MGLTVAIQMDPIEKIDIGGDSTFALALEAQQRGHNLLYYGPRDLSFRDGKAEYREVALGASIDGMRVVNGGLQAGERIVVKGLQRVRLDVVRTKTSSSEAPAKASQPQLVAASLRY